ncbi:MAG TPA: DUF1153 domain-containing protein [Stellaceae bacterium]|nr:DUF1153 domain-containing protein [Stellaceae bacterium]
MTENREAASARAAEVELPPAQTKRWVVRRKALVVAAVRSGALSLDDACCRYGLTVEEFLDWQNSIERHGLAGLRATWRSPRDGHAGGAEGVSGD